MPWTVEMSNGWSLPKVLSTYKTEREAGVAVNEARAKYAHLGQSVQFDVRYRAGRTPLVEWPADTSVSSGPES